MTVRNEYVQSISDFRCQLLLDVFNKMVLVTDYILIADLRSEKFSKSISGVSSRAASL